MVVLKFSKTSTSALVAHVDTLRAVTYIFRRANLPVEYSRGFNPHMELSFSPPLALGVESLCEYVSVRMPFCENLPETLNKVSPNGIKFERAFDSNATPAAIINSARFVVSADGIGNFAEEVLQSGYEISYFEKGETVTKDVSSKILGAKKIDVNTAGFTLSVGNNNLRPDRLANHILKSHGLICDCKIVKTESFVDGVLTDEYLLNH